MPLDASDQPIVHTPGPWNAVQWQADGHTYSHEVVADNGEEVAGILKADDARLIAAAPDMYRLIRKCYKVLHMGDWEVDETDQEVCEQINDAMWNHFGDGWRPKADEVV